MGSDFVTSEMQDGFTTPKRALIIQMDQFDEHSNLTSRPVTSMLGEASIA